MGISLKSEAVQNKDQIVQDLLTSLNRENSEQVSTDIAKVKNKRTKSSFLSCSKM